MAQLLALLMLLVAAALAYIAGPVLHLQGNGLLLFRVLVGVAGLAAAGLILYFSTRSRKQKAAAEGAVSTADLDTLLTEASRKLAASQQGGPRTLDRMPLFYLLGDADSAKTTTVLHSGLDPELIAGQASRSGDVVPTTLVNLWYTRQVAIAEVGAAVRGNAPLLARLIRRTRPRAYRAAFSKRAPVRAAVVCVSMERFLGADAAKASLASAQNTGAQLRELSRQLGSAIPIYVLFTKLDRVPHFAEFVRNLSADEAQQTLGTTLPETLASAGAYAEQATDSTGRALDAICFSLAEFRLDLLEREPDQKSTGSVYEFPRELRKLRNALSQCLVELTKPSQLSANPYLRGFYFTGVRAQIVEQMVTAPAAPAHAEVQDAGATRMFTLQDLQPRTAAPQQPAVVARKVPQWTFLPRVFPSVILGDKSALSASQEARPARLFRRVLFGVIAAACAVYLALLWISYRHNAALENEILSAAQQLPTGNAPAGALPTTHDLEALNRLRAEIQRLESFGQNGVPWSYRWGLYQGDHLAASARRIYFDRFRPILLSPAQSRILAMLGALPDTPAATAEYGAAYNPLKAYLITTTNPEKTTPEFLTPVLMQFWSNGASLDAQQQQLAREQMDFYAAELKRQNPYSINPDTAVVSHARAYLSRFGGINRIYQGMLDAANKSNPSIDFNRMYPRSSETVVDSHVVPGAFTRSGFSFMQDAILHPDRYFSGDTWVLGEQAAPSLDRASMTQQLTNLYTTDYLKEWHTFLTAAGVNGYRNLPDAAARLNLLASPTSPLLALFYTISHNTTVANPTIARAFQPAQVLVAPDSPDRWIGVGNKPYVDALQALGSSINLVVQSVAGPPDPTAGGTILQAASTAHGAVAQTSQPFSIEGDAYAKVRSLMEAPIKSAEGLVRGIGPAAANAGGKAFCPSFDAVMKKFPFTSTATQQATVPEVTAIFAPDTGALWQFYNTSLKTLLIPQGAGYGPAPNAPVQVTPGFLRFFNHAAAISTAFFPPPARTPTLAFSVHEVPTKGIQNATPVIDGQRINPPGAVQQFTWNGQTAQQAQLSVSPLDAKEPLTVLPSQGTWALFQLVRQATVQRSGGMLQLEFPLQISGSPIKLPDGTPLVVRFDLSGPGADLLIPGSLSGMRCVSQVAH